MPETLVKAAEQEDVRQAIDVVKQLKEANTRAWEIADAARGADGELVLKALDRIGKQIELQAKLLDLLHDQPQVNVLIASPEWANLRALILQALAPYPPARLAVAEVLDAG